ncbi:tho complex subunit 3 [Quercus suber]|uniref:Tho complex subunit 3 n=1 Tax=Quercus suber TaxID=58331 RepID=A0AAW0JEQ0_QUESU
MAQIKDTHIVEIPVDEEHQQKQLLSAIQHHPLMEISESPGHLLLLKLWQREEDLYGRRIALKETRIDSLKREVFQLCCFLFIFHGLFLTILFTSSIKSQDQDLHTHDTCKRWWIPALLLLSTSSVVVLLVQVKLFRFWKVWKQLQRERNDNRALARCTVEVLAYPSLRPLDTLVAHTAGCYCIAIDPMGRYFAVGSADSLVSLWEISEMLCVRTFTKLEWPVRTISFNYTGDYIASASEDLFIDISNVHTGRTVHQIPCRAAMNSVEWNPRYNLLAYAGDDKNKYQADEGVFRIFGFESP